MAKYQTSDIRNIALCGHGGAGKTMLAEAMLLQAGELKRLGGITDGSTVSDFEPEERERQCSLSTSVLRCDYKGKHFNIIDAPGAMAFLGGTVSALAAADLLLICINAMKGVEVMARKAWDLAEQMGVPRMFVITRMDGENVNFQEVLASVKNVFGTKATLFTLPDGEGASFEGVTRVMDPGASGEMVEEQKLQITESAVESDDALMEKYLEEGEVSDEEVLGVMQRAIGAGSLLPIFCVGSEKGIGVEELMDGIADWGPTPLDVQPEVVKGAGEEAETLRHAPAADGPLLARVFKVVSDPHVGKVSHIRVHSGTLEPKSSPLISATGKAERIAQLFASQGEERTEIDGCIAGDICCVTKVEDLHVGDTIYVSGVEERFAPLPFPKPMAGLAVSPKSRGDEQKMGTNLHRLCEEDPTFLFERNNLTQEQVVRGMGQIHLDVMLQKLKRRYKIEVDTKPPRIPYLETITQPGEGRYRHKKQTGGAGQFAEVWMRLKPNERGEGFEFVNAIVGGAISQPFIPSVEKGVRGAMDKGPVAGYTVVDVIAELYDGKEHPVDSKDIAFQLAGRHCFQEVMMQCKPVLLEPIVDMEIVFPPQFTGDISGDISQRRGRPTGMDQMGDMQVLNASVPLAEVTDYGSTLNAITQGEGIYSMELSHYEPVPSNIIQQIIAKAKAEAEEEK